MKKLDILAVGVHPDDVEIGCSGTLFKALADDKECGILDLTRGELGTRGSAEIRDQESEAARKVFGIDIRENLAFKDGFFRNDEEHQLAVIRIIRKYRPEIILCNAPIDRHPDHGRSSDLVEDAAFLSGLPKVETTWEGEKQDAWRPKLVAHYVQALHIDPDFVVDITDFFDKKMESIKAYKSQFHDPDSEEPETFISSPEFLNFIKARAIHFGNPVGFRYAEAYTTKKTVALRDVFALV